MNPVEIEEQISKLAAQPFDAAEFPYAFLEAFGNKDTTLRKLRSGASNKSDLGGVLQTNNIHIKVAPRGAVTKTLAALKDSQIGNRPRSRIRNNPVVCAAKFSAQKPRPAYWRRPWRHKAAMTRLQTTSMASPTTTTVFRSSCGMAKT